MSDKKDKVYTDDIKGEYIRETLSNYYDGEGELLILELQSGEKILGITDIEDPTIVSLVVHIVEFHEHDGSAYYRFYTYQNLADSVSELVLYQLPSLAYAPKSDIIDAYFNYWSSVAIESVGTRESNSTDYNGNFISTTTKVS